MKNSNLQVTLDNLDFMWYFSEMFVENSKSIYKRSHRYLALDVSDLCPRFWSQELFI